MKVYVNGVNMTRFTQQEQGSFVHLRHGPLSIDISDVGITLRAEQNQTTQRRDLTWDDVRNLIGGRESPTTQETLKSYVTVVEFDGGHSHTDVAYARNHDEAATVALDAFVDWGLRPDDKTTVHVYEYGPPSSDRPRIGEIVTMSEHSVTTTHKTKRLTP